MAKNAKQTEAAAGSDYGRGFDEELEVENELLDDNELEAEIASTDAEVRSIIDIVLQYVNTTKEDSKSNMQHNVRRWNRYRRMYKNRRDRDDKDSSIFKHVNVPKLAKTIDIARARHFALTVPDRSKLDFYAFIPEPSGAGELADPAAQQAADTYAKNAELAVRQDLIDGEFLSTYEKNLRDLYVTGNMVALMCYEQDIHYTYESVPNPEYRPDLGVEGIIKFHDDGTWEPIQQFTRRRKPVIDYDAPKVRYLNPLNVFPSEMDCDNIPSCSSVCVYDTCRKDELEKNEIETGGHLYTELDQITENDEQQGVPEIDDFHKDTRDRTDSTESQSNISSKKLRRITYFGRFVLDELIRDKNFSEAAIQRFYDKYGADPEKREHWKTWVIETINDSYMVRCQPLPYEVDEIPIIHFKLYSLPNETLGAGMYERVEHLETAYNFYLRQSMEGTLKMLNPQIGMMRTAFDQKWLMQKQGKLPYIPNEIWQLQNSASLAQAFQPMKYDSQPLKHCYEGMAVHERNLEEINLVPAVKQGTASGGNTATEVQMMGANADITIDQIAQDCETDFLHPMLWWTLKLHHQFSTHTKFFRRKNDRGEFEGMAIEPETWTRNWSVDLVGYRATGNLAVRQANFDAFMKTAGASGRLNWDEALPEYAKLMQVRDAARFLTPAPPPGPQIEAKLNLSLALEQTLVPPAVIGKVLAGMPLGPEELELFGIAPDGSLIEGGMLDQQAQMGMGGGGGMSALLPMLTGGGPPSGPAGKNPTEGRGGGKPAGEGFRNHHKMGEVDSRNRGTKDDRGVAAGTAQKTKARV